MSEETFNDFYQENRKLLSEYLETRLQLLRLIAIRTLSRTFSMFIVVCLVSFMSCSFCFSWLFHFHGSWQM